MNNKKETLTLKSIAAYLQIRPQRLLYKAQKLGLKIEEDGSVQKQHAIILVRSYLLSKKTSDETKQKALALINSWTNQTDQSRLSDRKIVARIATIKQASDQKWYKVP